MWNLFNKKNKTDGEHRTLQLITDKGMPFGYVEAYKSLRTNLDFMAGSNLSHIFWSSNSSFDCFQLHFVGESPFAGQDVLTLEIAVHHQYHSSIVRHLPHNNRQGVQPSKFSRILAAVPGDDLIAVTVRARAGNQRSQHTVLCDAFHRPGHGFIVQNLKGVVGEGAQRINGDLLHLFPLFLLSVFFGGK